MILYNALVKSIIFFVQSNNIRIVKTRFFYKVIKKFPTIDSKAEKSYLFFKLDSKALKIPYLQYSKALS